MLDAQNLRTVIAEGRLLVGDWVGHDAQGRELLCALAALSPEVRAERRAIACPARDCPQWVACLIPWIDDAVSDSARPRLLLRLADVAERLSDPRYAEALRRADYAARAVAVREARAHVDAAEIQVLNAVDSVLGLLDLAADCEIVPSEAWEAARSYAATLWGRGAASDAASEAARAAWEAARVATDDARSAREAADAAARVAAVARAAAARATLAAFKSRRVTLEAVWSAASEAADRIAAGILAVLERAVGLA